MRSSLLAVIAAALLASPLLAQANDTPAAVQKPFWVDTTDWDAVKTGYFISRDGQDGPILNKPVSAIEVRHGAALHPDGSHYDHLDTNKFYRDGQGRMRLQGSQMILIFDPTIDKTYALHRHERDYLESPAIYGNGQRTFPTAMALYGDSGYFGTVGNKPDPVREVIRHGTLGYSIMYWTPTNHVEAVELGTQTIDGLVCRGTRVTLTIPALDSKNDIHVVQERWYSDDLQVLVKSIHDDPRYGVSTYELTEITRAEPDPSLFKLPEGYTPTTDRNWIKRK